MRGETVGRILTKELAGWIGGFGGWSWAAGVELRHGVLVFRDLLLGRPPGGGDGLGECSEDLIVWVTQPGIGLAGDLDGELVL